VALNCSQMIAQETGAKHLIVTCRVEPSPSGFLVGLLATVLVVGSDLTG
jgi:hypothetical protein